MRRSLTVILLVILLTTGNSLLFLPDESEGFHLTYFNDRQTEKTITFSAPGTNTQTKIEIEKGSVLTDAQLFVEGLPDGQGRYPTNVTIDIGDDGDEEWKFKGTGYGELGRQTMFFNPISDNTVERPTIYFPVAGNNNTFTIRLPKGAQVASTAMEIRGTGASPGTRALREGSIATFTTNSPVGATRGYRFQVAAANLYVTELGVIIPPAYTGSSQRWLTLWDASTQGQLAQAQVPTPFPGGVWTWVPLVPPVALTQNSQYIISEWGTGYYYKSWGSYPTPWGGDANITVLSMRYANSGTKDTFPTSNINNMHYGIPDIGYTIGSGSSNGPQDPILDIGADGGTPEWNFIGEFSTKVAVPDFSSVLNTKLASSAPSLTDDYGNQFVDIPIDIAVGSDGAIELLNLSVTYTYKTSIGPNPDNTDLLTSLMGLIPSTDDGTNVSLTVAVESDSPGLVHLSNLDLVYNDAPILYELPSTMYTDEDTYNDRFLHLLNYTNDDIDSFDDLSFEVVYNSEVENVGINVTENGYLLVDTTKTENWNSEDYYEVLVQLKVTDTGDRSVLSNVFNIHVNAVNDEPTPNTDIPDISVSEGESDDSVNLDNSPYFTDIENDILYYDIEVDPLDVYQGENLSVELDQFSNTIKVTALGDFNTDDSDDIPLWVYCDDDEDVDTAEDINYSYQEILVTVEPVNDEPIWSQAIGEIHVEEDGVVEGDPPITLLVLSDIAFDVETPSEEMDYKIIENDQFSHTSLSIDGGTNELRLTSLTKDWTGTANVELAVSDSEAEEARTQFKLVVDPINDPPTITVTSHQDGDLVSGLIRFRGQVSDIEHSNLIAEIKIGSEDWKPVDESGIFWSHMWNTTFVENGEHTISFRSYDGEAYSQEITIVLTIENIANIRPTVSISSPSENEKVTGVVKIDGGATDENDVKNVSLRIDDGIWYDVNGTLYWSFLWDTTTYANGEHKVSVRS